MSDTQVHIALQQLFPELNLSGAEAGIAINNVEIDSRNVTAGALFIALEGARVDGRQFIPAAIVSGAAAVAVESTQQKKAGSIEYYEGVPVIAVAHLAERVSALAGQCYGDPSTKMKVMGVTGTNGKSTCASLVAQLYSHAGLSAGSIGTLGVFLNGQSLLNLNMTTPDPSNCQKILAKLAHRNVEIVALEVSSHALDQHRVAGIKFHTGVFTNIGHDHLDYHDSIENYVAAKLKLFEVMGLENAVINLDDPFAQQMLRAAKKNANVVSYSLLHFAADIYASDIQYSADGVNFRLKTCWGDARVHSPLLGEFNVYNLIASIAVLCADNYAFKDVLSWVSHLQAVPGRMQRLDEKSDVMVIVDYAHTPDALVQAIAAARAHTAGNLNVVFGCGGNRDVTKRAKMAEVCERYADRVMVTSDNPRFESPEAIARDICAGFNNQNVFELELDRKLAIEKVIADAKPTDVILIAGKGHEKYQIVNDEELPFDDVAVAAAAIRQRNQHSGGV